ncbi:type II secretion system F family protein [Pseudooceanicola nanhaiensis]|uniref:type II secretion system F family protein n=1 Tax=Pseudooceanicola nanhaiensis TaxID=375761 RepID=UPI001CD4C8AA|nr:type II secretion system F family protein [Pseudooceanicola nanhaiensis]MCA0919481.1 type II secretion system F family protein [Pseudooceanicola nanhaiensis]
MTNFVQLLTQAMGPMGPVIAGAGVIGVVLVLAALAVLMKKQADPLDKLKAENDAQKSDKKDRLRNTSRNDKLEKYSSFLEPKNEEEYSAMRMKLLQAGYRSKDAVRFFHFAQFALGLLGLLIGVVYFMLVISKQEPSTAQTIMWVMGPGAVGYLLPKYWITKRQAERQQMIQDGFPDALDMLLVCVEAGQSMDQSIIRVAKEIRTSFPPLADEFELVSHEIKAGKDKSQVLNDMAERCGVMDISSFVTVLVQSATFGTSIADALRVYASEMRDKRVMRAEEKANKLPTKMTLATMMLTVPPLLIILVGPSVVGIMNMGAIGVGN